MWPIQVNLGVYGVWKFQMLNPTDIAMIHVQIDGENKIRTAELCLHHPCISYILLFYFEMNYFFSYIVFLYITSGAEEWETEGCCGVKSLKEKLENRHMSRCRRVRWSVMAGLTSTCHDLVLEDKIVLANQSVSRDVIYSGDEAMWVTFDHREKETMFFSQVEGEDMQWRFRSWRRGWGSWIRCASFISFPRSISLLTVRAWSQR